MKKHWYIIFSCITISLQGSELPSTIKAILDEHSAELTKLLKEWQQSQLPGVFGGRTAKVSWLSGYIIKYGIKRVENVQRLKEVITKNNLDVLRVPEKYVYQVFDQGTSTPTNENSVVIAQKIEGQTGQGIELDLQQTQQIYRAAIETRYYDMHPANMIKTSKKHVYIIDTDEVAMPSTEETAQLHQDWLSNGTRVRDENSSGIIMSPPVINDPSIKLELAMYSKHRNYRTCSNALKM